MLKACEKDDYRAFIALSKYEDRALRMAYGRFASPEARAAGAEVVQRFQHKGPGYWIACDCLDGLEERPPVLIPVLESFIPVTRIRRGLRIPSNATFSGRLGRKRRLLGVMARPPLGHCA